jgi:hypothetical protein
MNLASNHHTHINPHQGRERVLQAWSPFLTFPIFVGVFYYVKKIY